MEFRVRINDKTVFVLLIVAALVSAVGITLAQVPNPGHPWSQIECVNCIATGNLADDSVTSAKIVDGQVQSADIGDGQVTNAKIDSMDWNKLNNRPSGLDEGDNYTSCNWDGTYDIAAITGATRTCGGCCSAGYYCQGSCIQARFDKIKATCNSVIVTEMTYTVGSYGPCTCSGTCVGGGTNCPFIYSWNGREYVLETTILYKLDSEDKEAVQYRELQYLDTSGQVRAKIAEREHETSYIDRIQIVVTDSANGEEEVTILNPVSASRGLSLISESDDSYLVMEYGDEVCVDFGQAPEPKDGFSRSVEVRAEGYYIFQ